MILFHPIKWNNLMEISLKIDKIKAKNTLLMKQLKKRFPSRRISPHMSPNQIDKVFQPTVARSPKVLSFLWTTNRKYISPSPTHPDTTNTSQRHYMPNSCNSWERSTVSDKSGLYMQCSCFPNKIMFNSVVLCHTWTFLLFCVAI